MKRIATALTLCFMLLLFAGCQSDNVENQPGYTMRLESASGKIVSFAHSEKEAEKVLGRALMYLEFEEEGTERRQYDMESEGILVDYLGDKIVALRIEDVGEYEFEEDWYAVLPLDNGGSVYARLGDKRSELAAPFDSATYIDQNSVNDGRDVGFSVAYDLNFLPCTYSEDAPYLVHFRCQDGVLEYIILQDNHSF